MSKLVLSEEQLLKMVEKGQQWLKRVENKFSKNIAGLQKTALSCLVV